VVDPEGEVWFEDVATDVDAVMPLAVLLADTIVLDAIL